MVRQKHHLDTGAVVNENLDEGLTKKKFGITTIFDGITGCIAPGIPMMSSLVCCRWYWYYLLIRDL